MDDGRKMKDLEQLLGTTTNNNNNNNNSYGTSTATSRHLPGTYFFNKKYIDDNSEDRRKDGLRICRMLNNVKSKVYCLHDGQDFALLGSTVQKLGTGGLGLGGTDQSRCTCRHRCTATE